MASADLVIITGASSGIGRAAARRFAAAGHPVVAIARTRSKLEELAADYPNIEPEALDAGDGKKVLEMAERVLAKHGAPWVVINSAGAGRWLDIEETSPDELASMMSAPFNAAFHMCHAFVGPMRRRGRGALIHVGSPASVQPWPGATGYTCSRWALRGLHESLRVDLAGSGVSSCHVIFGEVTSAYFDNNPDSYERVPVMGRMFRKLTPEQCADTLFDVAHKPTAERIEPPEMRLVSRATSLAPSVTRRLLVLTGRQR